MGCECSGRCRCWGDEPKPPTTLSLVNEYIERLEQIVRVERNRRIDQIVAEYDKGLIVQHELVERLNLVIHEGTIALVDLGTVARKLDEFIDP